MNIAERVNKALENMAKDGITGWGLRNPAPDLFHATALGEPEGCHSETCNHVSHDPAASTYRLTLKNKSKRLVLLGENEGGDLVYIVESGGNAETAFTLECNHHYHDKLRQVSLSDVPDYLWAKLAE